MSLGLFGHTSPLHRRPFAYALSDFTVGASRANVWTSDRGPLLAAFADRGRTDVRKEKPTTRIVPVPEDAPLHSTRWRRPTRRLRVARYRTLTTARGRVEHLRGFFGSWAADAITPDSVRNYQLHRRNQGAEASTINRETSGLSRMFQLAIRRGQLERMPLFPKRLEENPPRDGFFEHDEYLKVRSKLPAPFQDVLDFAYYSGWRRNEILGLTWEEVDSAGGVIGLTPRRSKTKTGRVLPISAPLQQVLKRRRDSTLTGSSGVSSRWCFGPGLANSSAGCLSESQSASSVLARLPADGGAESDPRGGAGTGRDVAHWAQDAVGV